MGGANNWRKKSEDSDIISWIHNGGYDFVLSAEKRDNTWLLSLSSSVLPEKYDKKILETNTKKRVRSFAVDWRKSHTETKELLNEVGISTGNSRKIFNPFNMSLALMNLFLFLALLQTWRFIDPIFDDILMGIIMGAGGLIFLVEGFYEKEKFNIRAPFRNSNDLVSTLTGTFAVLSSYGYITGSEFHLTHFSGVQGGILAYMFAYLLIHWLKHRFLGYTQLTIRSTKNKATKLKKSFISIPK